MFKKLLFLATVPVLAYADDGSNSYYPFQKINSEISIGNVYSTGSIFGTNYTANGIGLVATKQFDNNVWVNLAADVAYNTNMNDGYENILNADVGYGFQFGRFQVIPNLQLQRYQVGYSTMDSNTNAIVTDELLDVHLELVLSSRLMLFGDGGYGIGQYNTTNNTLNSTSNTNVPSTGSSGVLQTNLGLTYRPIVNVPWLFKGQYVYRNYDQTNIGATSGYMLSTGIAF